MVTSEAVVLTLQREGEMEGERGKKKKEERCGEVLMRPFVSVSRFAVSFPPLLTTTQHRRIPQTHTDGLDLHAAADEAEGPEQSVTTADVSSPGS